MSANSVAAESQNYASRFVKLAWLSLAQLVRSPSHSRRAEAARRAARHVLWLSAGLGAAIIVLMYAIDAWEIAQMPKRGTPSLWWLRILTDFGKDEYVLAVLAGLLIAVAIVSPALRGIQRSLLLGLGTRLQFIFFAVAVSNLVTEVLKYCIGRGRPFVGGEANAFHFSHFAGNPAYYSFPSGHATTAFALALAVSAVWPQARACDGRLCHLSLRRPVWCWWPTIRATWLPARWSGSSARCSCATGLRPAGWGLRSSATVALCPLSGLRPDASKGLPAALWPHKSGRRLTARYARFRVLPKPTRRVPI